MSPVKVLHHLYLLAHQIGNEFRLVRAERKRLERRVTELEGRFGAMQRRSMDYKGIWREESVPYRAGELVTHKGALWHA
jgi:hypothetical protein